jgi:hypothetical protein
LLDVFFPVTTEATCEVELLYSREFVAQRVWYPFVSPFFNFLFADNKRPGLLI